MLSKVKRVRLKGKALKELNDRIHERDNHKCIICGAEVDPGEKFHHYPQGADKQDKEECGVLLCYTECHQQAHHGPHSAEIKQQVKWYLQKLYCPSEDTDHCKECDNMLCEGSYVRGEDLHGRDTKGQ